MAIDLCDCCDAATSPAPPASPAPKFLGSCLKCMYNRRIKRAQAPRAGRAGCAIKQRSGAVGRGAANYAAGSSMMRSAEETQRAMRASRLTAYCQPSFSTTRLRHSSHIPLESGIRPLESGNTP